MKYGVFQFSTDYSIRIDELARFYERSGRPEEADMARRDLEGLRGSLPRGRVAAGPP